MKSPLVSVCVLVYNFEQYISECLDSILKQETNFDFEVVIGEDCSPDNSREICKQYQQRYPKKVRLIQNEHNMGLMRNYENVLNAANGKYIAFCAGDDYWCESKKLQKQVDFLETNDDYGVVFTAGYNLCNGTLTPHAPAMGSYHNGDMREECVNYTIGYASSVMYRKNLLDYIDFEDYLKSGIRYEDYIMYAIFSMHCKFAFLEDRTMVYRIIKTSLSHSCFSVNYIETWANTRRYLQKHYPEVCHFDMDDVDDTVNYSKLKRALFDGKYKDAMLAKAALKTTKYKSKRYSKMLNGRLSFGLLYIQMKIRLLFNVD